jgi:alpha-tubulin suppressor-like RCC1 family protein
VTPRAALYTCLLVVACIDPTGPRTPRIKGVTAGASHTCAVTDSGVGYCWGANERGQLGDGTTQGRLTPTAIVPVSAALLSIDAGFEHTCALAVDGAYCWGLNSAGRLGDGTTSSRSEPAAVSVPAGTTFMALSAGSNHSCAVASVTGTAWCWGFNLDGQLGDGTSTSRLTPVPVMMPSGVTFVGVGAANEFTCAGTSTGAAYCWGANSFGRLGDGTLTDRSTPTLVATPGPMILSGIGPDHSCSVGAMPTCWGYNAHGELGDGTTTARLVPTAVAKPSGVSFNVIATGGAHSCALNAGGVYCWGHNGSGQLGDGTTTDRLTPVVIAMPPGVAFEQLALGEQHTCAIARDRTVYCWGNNASGQLGDGTTTNRLTPVHVSWPLK